MGYICINTKSKKYYFFHILYSVSIRSSFFINSVTVKNATTFSFFLHGSYGYLALSLSLATNKQRDIFEIYSALLKYL